MNNKTIYRYYFILFLILAVWSGESSLPMPVRLLYLGMLVVPLLKRSDLIPAVFAGALTVSYNSFTAPILPTEDYYYMVILGGLALLLNKSTKVKGYVFFVFLLYVLFVDLVTQGHISRLFSKMFICILTYLCVKDRLDRCKTPMEIAFMVCSIILSYWTLFRLDARMRTIHAVEGMDEAAGWTDPNYLGCIIGLGGLIAIKELISASKSEIPRILSIITIVISLFALAYLASRGAILALAAGAVILFTFSKRTKSSYKVLFVIAMSALLFFMYQSSVFDALEARFTSDTMATGTGRTEIWAIKLSSFFNDGNILNIIFGYGQEKGFELGNFGRARAFHNDFIAFLVEYGFVGLILFLSALSYPVRRASRSIRNTILGFVTFIAVAGLTLEPISSDMPNSIAFTFFILYVITAYKSGNAINRSAV